MQPQNSISHHKQALPRTKCTDFIHSLFWPKHTTLSSDIATQQNYKGPKISLNEPPKLTGTANNSKKISQVLYRFSIENKIVADGRPIDSNDTDQFI
jgi:hypothetical protein